MRTEQEMLLPNRSRLWILAFAAVFWISAAAPADAADRPVTLEVDAREAARKLFHARLVIPVRPGPLTLLYPKWLPGDHEPSGPI
ncbi:MAG TPA: hypothetical protein VK780_01050, partial [Thermoanaerobaculia bacterium]|nr:hypothetical protein [Thermoanaerobaculia bacterium]